MIENEVRCIRALIRAFTDHRLAEEWDQVTSAGTGVKEADLANRLVTFGTALIKIAEEGQKLPDSKRRAIESCLMDPELSARIDRFARFVTPLEDPQTTLSRLLAFESTVIELESYVVGVIEKLNHA